MIYIPLKSRFKVKLLLFAFMFLFIVISFGVFCLVLFYLYTSVSLFRRFSKLQRCVYITLVYARVIRNFTRNIIYIYSYFLFCFPFYHCSIPRLSYVCLSCTLIYVDVFLFSFSFVFFFFGFNLHSYSNT